MRREDVGRARNSIFRQSRPRGPLLFSPTCRGHTSLAGHHVVTRDKKALLSAPLSAALLTALRRGRRAALDEARRKERQIASSEQIFRGALKNPSCVGAINLYGSPPRSLVAVALRHGGVASGIRSQWALHPADAVQCARFGLYRRQLTQRSHLTRGF